MADKPPIPVKSDRLKNLPKGGKRPPPKPVPYQVHKSQKQGVGAISASLPAPILLTEPGKKPEPTPRRISPEGRLPGQLHRGPNLPDKPSKSSRRINDGSNEKLISNAQKWPGFRRPRLNTPLSPPDPSVMANGLKIPPVSPLRGSAAASGSVATVMNGRGNSLGHKVPPRAAKNSDQLNHEGKVAEEVEEVEKEGDVYSTVVDKPRRVISPPIPPSKPPLLPRPPRTSTPPNQRSKVASRFRETKNTKREVAPPKQTSSDSYSFLSRPDRPDSNAPTASALGSGAPLLYSSLEGQGGGGSSSPPFIPPRRTDDPHRSYDCLEFGDPGASTPSESYSMTVHSAETKRLKGHVPPQPTPAEEYSPLSRPDHPKKDSSLSCVQNPNVPGAYSSLEAVEGSGGLSVPPRREGSNSTSAQGYSHLEFGGLSEADMNVVREHYWMGDSESAVNEGTSADIDVYELVGDPVNEERENDGRALHKALCETKSAPVDGNQDKLAQSQDVSRHTCTSQKTRRARASRDRYSLQMSRDRSVFAAYQDDSMVDMGGKILGESSPPNLPPSPKRQKKPRLLGGQKKGGNPQGIKPERREGVEEEDFYTIPPDAKISDHNSGHVGASAETDSLLPVSLKLLEQAGYETWRSVSPVEDDAAMDGRESRSSLMTECVVELRNLHSTSPHTLVSIDQLVAEKEKRESEGKVIETAEEKATKGKVSISPSNQPANRCESYDFEGSPCNGMAQDSEEKLANRDRGAVDEEASSKPADDDLSQYDLQTVTHPPASTNMLGYCEIDVQGQASRVCERPAELHVVSLEGTALMDDLSSYDLQTVSHAPVAMSFQGYSYCGVGPRNLARCKPSNATSNTTTTAPSVAVDYTEIDIMSPTRIKLPQAFSPCDRPPSKHPSSERSLCEGSQSEHSSSKRPLLAPKPRKKRNNSRDDSVSVGGILGTSSTDDGGAETERAQSLPISGGQNQHDLGSRDLHTPEGDLSDDDADGLYARVVDIKARKERKSGTSSPKPSPKVNQKENTTKPLPKVTKKPRGPPRRQPPPPPPGVSPPPRVSFAAHSQGTPPSSSANSGAGKRAPVTASAPGEMELSLPPLLTQPRLGRSAATSATSDFTTSYYSPSEKHKVLPPSPKLLQKGFSSSPSHSMQQGSPQQQQQAQWKSIFSRGKSRSLRNKPDGCAAVSPVSPLAGDRDAELERAEKKSEQSPKLKWRDKFRLRRTSSNGISNNGETDGSERNERKRRNQEEKLPEVPVGGKTKSLPASARLDSPIEGVHIHNGSELEEEAEDDLGGIYSVVGVGAQSPKTMKVHTVHTFTHRLLGGMCVYSTCILMYNNHVPYIVCT